MRDVGSHMETDMKTALALIAAAILVGCTSTPTPMGVKERVSTERQQDRVRNMQDEFNRLTGDAY